MIHADVTVANAALKSSAAVIQSRVGKDIAESATRCGTNGISTTAFVCAIAGVATITYSIY